MNEAGVSELLGKVAALVEQFDRRCEQTSRELGVLAQQMPGTVRQATDEQLGRLHNEVLGRVRGGIEQPVSAYEQRLQEAGNQLRQASHALAGQLHRAEALHRQLVWKVAAVTFGCLLLLLVGGVWLSRHYYDEIRRNQLSADLLRAYNQADVSLCDGRLCVRVDKDGKPYGDYVPVALR